MNLRALPLLSVLAISVAIGKPACANDTFVTLAAGGLVPVKSSSIMMESEDLEISVHRVAIKYVFRNDSDRDVTATVAFPLPELEGGTVENEPLEVPKEALNFLDFKVNADGKPVSTEMEARAYLGKQDITSRLQAIGLPVSVFLVPLNTALLKLSPAQRQQLEKEGLIVAEDNYNPPLPGIGKRGWWAAWTMRVQFYWTQRFPASSTVELEQTYRPVVGGSYIVASDDGSASVEPYCGAADTLRRIAAVRARHPEHDPVLAERRIDYILTTGNNWKGPIRHFRLAVSTDSSDDILVTCMPGMKPVGATRYEFLRQNFRPDSDLKLLILAPWREVRP